MADFEFDNPAFDRDDDVDDDVDDETPLIEPNSDIGVGTEGSTAGGRVQSLQQELLQTTVDNYYEALANNQELTPPLGRDVTKFELVDGRLRLKAYPNLDIVNKRTGAPLALSTVASRGGTKAIRDELGFVDWTGKKPSLPPQAVKSLQTANQELGEAAAAAETFELKDLGQTAKEASDAVQRIETTFNDAEIDEVLETINDPPLTLREIRGLDRALQTIRGELTNNLAKLSELDKHIAVEKCKLALADDSTTGLDEFERRRIAERIRNLEDERTAHLEAASTSREALRSQISRMRETIRRMIDEDTTLAERVRTLFREQGITIASILTAIGMAISTLVLALTGSGGVTPSPTPPPSDKGGLRDWLKKHLQSLGRVLAKLAGKAATALPGIIGSVVQWLLGLLAKTAGWLAENLWAVLLALGSLLLFVAREWISPK